MRASSTRIAPVGQYEAAFRTSRFACAGRVDDHGLPVLVVLEHHRRQPDALRVSDAEAVVDGDPKRHQSQATGKDVSERNWMLGW